MPRHCVFHVTEYGNDVSTATCVSKSTRVFLRTTWCGVPTVPSISTEKNGGKVSLLLCFMNFSILVQNKNLNFTFSLKYTCVITYVFISCIQWCFFTSSNYGTAHLSTSIDTSFLILKLRLCISQNFNFLLIYSNRSMQCDIRRGLFVYALLQLEQLHDTQPQPHHCCS